jgi:MFS transporter, putative metabolite:H+ symporter
VRVEEAIDRVGFGAFQRRLFLVCGVTWAVDAAEIFLLSFALPGISRDFDLTPAAAGALVTSTFAVVGHGPGQFRVKSGRVAEAATKQRGRPASDGCRGADVHIQVRVERSSRCR